MTSVILVQCTNKPFPYSEQAPPVTLLSCAGFLQENGYKVKIVDARVNKEWLIKFMNLLDENVEFVGINVTSGESISQGLKASEVAKANNIQVIWMGLHPSALPEQTLKHELVDKVIIGNPTGMLPWIDEEYSIEGPCGYLNMDQIPFLPYELINLEDYGEGGGLPIQTSIGCPYNCSFCTNRLMNDSQWSAMSPERIIEHINYYKEKFKIRDFYFIDDNFCASIPRVERTVDLLIKEKCDIDWSTSCRVNYVKDMSPHLIQRMKKAGCWNLAFGFESGSSRILELINKGITNMEILHAAKKLKKNNMSFGGTFVTGFPTETKADMYPTMGLITCLMKIDPESTFEIYDYIPCPGTDLFNLAVENGFPNPNSLDEWSKVDFLQKPWISRKHKEWLQEIKDLAFMAGRPKHNCFNLQQKLMRAYELIIDWDKYRWKNEMWGPVPEKSLYLFCQNNINYLTHQLSKLSGS